MPHRYLVPRYPNAQYLISKMSNKHKYNISPEGRKVRSEHGRKVLAEWKAENPDQGKIVSGSQSKTILAKYDDRSTPEGAAMGETSDMDKGIEGGYLY
jgi:hypothetical protein